MIGVGLSASKALIHPSFLRDTLLRRPSQPFFSHVSLPVLLLLLPLLLLLVFNCGYTHPSSNLSMQRIAFGQWLAVLTTVALNLASVN